MKRTHWSVRLTAALTALVLAVSLSGCGASGGDKFAAADVTESTEAAAMPEETLTSGSTADGAEAGEGAGTVTLDPGATSESARKIIYTANLELEATDFDAARTALMEAVEAQGGYLEHSSQDGSAEYQSRSLTCTVRVPAEHYRAFLESAAQVGSQRYLSEDANDITAGYVDVEARLAALENQRDRLNALAASAETTADLLEIESQLSDVQYEIENYTRQLRAMDDQISYSTVNINLYEVAVLTPVTPVTFGEKLGRAFGDGWEVFVDFIQGIVLAVVYMWPLVILAVVVIAVLLATRPARRARRQAKAAAKQAARSQGNTAYTYPTSANPDPSREEKTPPQEDGTPKY